MTKKATLNAVRKSQDKIEYSDNEVTLTEQDMMKTKSYKRLENKEQKVEKSLKQNKENFRVAKMEPKKQTYIKLSDIR